MWNQNISLTHLVDSGTILCWAAKWLGEDEVIFDSVFKSKPKRMLKNIHKLMDEADVICTWNGNKFDIPTLNKEFLLHGLTPPAPFKQMDLLQTSRSKFRFTSNKLDYVSQALGVGQKHKHDGFSLWIGCMEKDPESWATMEEYNKQDVKLLEQVYYIFRPWIKNHPNSGLYLGVDTARCPNCGSEHLQRRGFGYTALGKYQRYRCSSCGHWSRSRTQESKAPPIVSEK